MPGLRKTIATSRTDRTANQISTAADRSGDQDAAALVAVRDLAVGQLAEACDLHGRQRQVAAAALRTHQARDADATGSASQRCILGEQVGGNGRDGDLAALLAQVTTLATTVKLSGQDRRLTLSAPRSV